MCSKNSTFISFTEFVDDDEFQRITHNPLRKLNKKLRNKKKRYEKTQSPEILNEIEELEKKINLFFPKNNPVKKKKKKKFKKIKIDKAKLAREKREREEKERKERYFKKYYKWRNDFKLKPIFKEQIKLPEDIICFMENPNKKTYYILQKKYHPDKNKNGLEYSKFINNYWENHCK
tara:strand:- start:750 stop:1277 length:528 start_codon:yes stop_codon:yes gene_type:complete